MAYEAHEMSKPFLLLLLHLSFIFLIAPFVRPGAAGLLTGIECSRVRNNAWDIPYHIVTTRTEVGLVE